MNKMKEIIKEKNVYRWASKFILELSNLKITLGSPKKPGE